MTWFKVDDTLSAHPKTRRAGLAAMGLWTVAGSWSSQQLTEGFIPEWFADTWPQGRKLAAKLVSAGFWSAATEGGEKGWRFHDWTDCNPTAEQERKRRQDNRERQKRAREKAAEERAKARDGVLDREATVAEVSRGTSRVTGTVTHDATSRVGHSVSHGPPDPTRPDPSRSLPAGETTRTALGGDLAEADARTAPPRFPDHCPDHADVAVPGKCGDCKDQREANAAEAAAPDYRLRVVRDLCGECDDRWIEMPDGSIAHCPRCHPAEVRPA